MNFALGLLVILLTGATPKFTPYTAKADPFRAAFPGAPKVESSKDKGVTTRSYTLDSEFAVYMVMVVEDRDITLESATEELEAFRDAEKESAKILSEKKVSFGTAPGIELKLQSKDLDSLARMYVIKGRTFAAIVDVDHGHTIAEAGVEAFFDAFALTDKSVGAAAPAPVVKPVPAPSGAALSSDGVEVLGFTADGSKAVTIEHGVYDGKGTPWAKVTFFDTVKASVIGKPIALELESTEDTEQAVVAEARKRAEAERVRLKLAPLVAARKLAMKEMGETGSSAQLTARDGSPLGGVEVKSSRGKKVTECMEGFAAELVTVHLALMDGDENGNVVLAEKKTPATVRQARISARRRPAPSVTRP